MKTLVLCCFLLTEIAFAQQRYLVSPNDDFIPIKHGESAKQIMSRKLRRHSLSQSSVCTNKALFGYPEDLFEPAVNHVARHKDVMGEWFLAKASGTIDTLFWEVLSDVGALDSTVFVRVHESNIGPSAGPGIRPGPYNPPCQNWGYWVNTADLDQGVAAFPEDATDTTWHSTYNGPINSFPPFGNSLWGGSLGVAVTEHLGINSVVMLQFDTLKVTTGQNFFISMRVKGPVFHPSPLDDWTSWATASFRVSDVADENYPSRNWKFYEHDSGPANCAGVPVNDVKRGWVARGGFGQDSDSLDVAALNWWFVMTVTSNVPPVVSDVTGLHNTFNTGPQTVEATITDCDLSVGGHPGVESAVLKWSLNGNTQPDILVNNVGGDSYEVTIPGQPAGSTVSYRIYAEDSVGVTSFGPQYTYKVVSLGSAYYYPDTGALCVSRDISTSGTSIDPNSFYLPPGASTTATPKDDGSWGPIDMGFSMRVFGSDNRYAWVGVNGAIALSNNAADTVDVNSTGFYTTTWDFPDSTRTGGRSDTSNGAASRMPRYFISPFWNDLFLGDTTTTCGRIMYGNAGDTCIFVVEWDSIGTFLADGNTTCDETTFRIVLNRCDGTVEFQYDNVGLTSLDSLALVGMQGANSAEYIFINKQTYPAETKPRNGWCIKLYPGSTIYSLDGWNMVSLGVTPLGGNYSKATNFPTAVGPMFAYNGSYTPSDPLSNGPGFWAKFNGPQHVGARGTLLSSLNIPVVNGWNMMGGIGCDVATSSIGVSGGTVASSYFGYGGAGYYVATTIEPGLGYWMKMNGAGTLSLNYPSAAPKQSLATDLNTLNKITIIDAAGRQQSLYIGDENSVREPLAYYELPPSAPGFDVRYTSGRMVETYPAKLEQKGVYEYPISISEASYPLTIQWTTVKGAGRSLVLTSADGKLGNTVMNGSGAVRITDAGVKNIVLTLNDVQTPTRFALGQNYPNPFNPTTRFTIEMPKTAEVTVAIYDILGRQITTLLRGQQAAGYHNLEWDGRDARGLSAPTGIYFIRMAAGEFDQTQKIMLMK